MDTPNTASHLSQRLALSTTTRATTERLRPTRASASCSQDQLLRTFSELRDTLVSTLWHIMGNKEDAQDAAQDAFLKCWRAHASLRDIQNLRAWIFRVAINVARDRQSSPWHRRSQQLVLEADLLTGNGTRPEQIAERQEEEERLRCAIHRLRRDEKEVFLLRQNSDLTFEQIALVRGSPVSTVKTQMRRALHKLRQRLTVHLAPIGRSDA